MLGVSEWARDRGRAHKRETESEQCGPQKTN